MKHGSDFNKQVAYDVIESVQKQSQQRWGDLETATTIPSLTSDWWTWSDNFDLRS
jgi:hypothetical protein